MPGEDDSMAITDGHGAEEMSGHVVTRAELNAVQAQVHTEIRAVTRGLDELKDVVEADRRLQAERDATLRQTIERQGQQWRDELAREREARKFPLGAVVSGLIGLFVLLLTIAGMSATLVVFAISGAVQPVQRDVAENIEELETHWELTFPRLRWEGMMEERMAWVQREAEHDPEMAAIARDIQRALSQGPGVD